MKHEIIAAVQGFGCSRWIPVLCCLSLLAGCATSPPTRTDNICDIFYEKEGWYKATLKSSKRWGAPVHVQMAILHQESKFRAKAKPPRYRFLGLIPLWRPSSAYGYAQVLDPTWERYKRATGNGGADRDDFADAVDFVGWYVSLSHRELGLSKWDAYNQYLAYHEGQTGFKRKTWKNKAWLVKVARRVEANAKRFSRQLAGCADSLDKGHWWWPF